MMHRVARRVLGALLLGAAMPALAASAQDFDFWLGDWDLSWADGGQGSNRITRILDGRVIHEHFHGGDSSPLRGISVSVYEPQSGRWSQTWVDNQGGYLDFHGGRDGDRMILSRSFEKDGQLIHQRMVWYDITPDSLQWNWERSTDEGQTWSVAWHIDYRRKR